MALRTLVAYGLLALIVLFFAGLAGWLRYNARDRTIARWRRREDEADQRRRETGTGDGAE